MDEDGMEMTPRERTLTAFKLGTPDRVPVFPWLWNLVPAKLTGHKVYDFGPVGHLPIWKAQLETIKHFEADGWIFASLGDSSKKGYRVERKVIDLADDVKEVVSLYHTSKGQLHERRLCPPDSGAWVLEGKIKDFAQDVQKLKEISFPDPWTCDTSQLEEMVVGAGELAVAHGIVGSLFFDTIAGNSDGGGERAIYDLFDHEKECRHLQRLHADHTREVARVLVEKVGVDAVFLGMGYSSASIMGPDMWRKWNVAAIRSISEITKRHGVPLHMHCHGKRKEIVEYTIEAGVDVLDPFERPPMGDADLAEIKEKYGARVCICGNVHTIHSLLNGSPQLVEEDVRDCIAKGARGGGFVLNSGEEVARDTPFANIEAMVRAGKKYGKYPVLAEGVRS